MTNGVNVVEMDWTWDCPACEHANEDVTMYVEAEIGNAICEKCKHETEVNL
jgi:transcription elongation factor Elf1